MFYCFFIGSTLTLPTHHTPPTHTSTPLISSTAHTSHTIHTHIQTSSTTNTHIHTSHLIHTLSTPLIPYMYPVQCTHKHISYHTRTNPHLSYHLQPTPPSQHNPISTPLVALTHLSTYLILSKPQRKSADTSTHFYVIHSHNHSYHPHTSTPHTPLHFSYRQTRIHTYLVPTDTATTFILLTAPPYLAYHPQFKPLIRSPVPIYTTIHSPHLQ
jgi:hypothetical protein